MMYDLFQQAVHIAYLPVFFGVLCFIFFLYIDGYEKPRMFVLNYRIHHSFVGLLIFLVGYFFGSHWVTSFGIGLYLSHVAEHVYFHNDKLSDALFIFITKE